METVGCEREAGSEGKGREGKGREGKEPLIFASTLTTCWSVLLQPKGNPCDARRCGERDESWDRVTDNGGRARGHDANVPRYRGAGTGGGTRWPGFDLAARSLALSGFFARGSILGGVHDARCPGGGDYTHYPWYHRGLDLVSSPGAGSKDRRDPRCN